MRGFSLLTSPSEALLLGFPHTLIWMQCRRSISNVQLAKGLLFLVRA